jgi:riboflavin kinase/FMN adenylyltransferase
MRIQAELEQAPPGRAYALTVGVFDGVHRGHRHLLSALVSEAGKAGLASGVLTFRNHPSSVLRPDFEPRYLTTLESRIDLLESSGVDYVMPVTFDAELSKMDAHAFISMLQERLGMRALVVGPDFAMGHRRSGTTTALSDLAPQAGFELKVVEPLHDASGKPVRSSSVRDSLAAGDVCRVGDLLGRKLALKGRVVEGYGRGASLGYPTANLETPPSLALPGDGVYTTWATVAGRRYMSATSIGARPTFGEGGRAVEVFILDYSGDIYGSDVELEFVGRLRGQIAFDSVEALQHQMHEDVNQARTALAAGSAQPV